MLWEQKWTQYSSSHRGYYQINSVLVLISLSGLRGETQLSVVQDACTRTTWGSPRTQGRCETEKGPWKWAGSLLSSFHPWLSRLQLHMETSTVFSTSLKTSPLCSLVGVVVANGHRRKASHSEHPYTPQRVRCLEVPLINLY